MLKKLINPDFIIYLIPLSFVAGPLILELILIYLSYFYVKNIIAKNDHINFLNFFSKVFFSFSLYLIICLIIFSRFDQGILYSLFYFRYGIYVLALYYFLKKNKNIIEKFLKLFLILNFILIIDAIFQNIFGFNLVGINQVDMYRVSSFFGEELILGSFLIKISPLIFSLAYIKEDNPKKLLIIPIIICSILNLYVISISGGRSSLFMYIIFLIYLFVFLKVNLYKKLTFIGVVFSLLFLIFSTNENVLERVVKKTYFEFTGKSISDLKDPYKTEEYFKLQKFPLFIFSPAHTNYYATSLKIFNDNKFFGAGPKSYRELCKNEKYNFGRYSCTTHSHNYYIQLLAETGFFGFMFLIMTYLSLIIIFFKNLLNKSFSVGKKNFNIILIGGLLINFFPFMPTGNFFNNWNTILIFLPIPFLMWGLNDRN